MAEVIITDSDLEMVRRFEKAAVYLREQGHVVHVMTDGDEAFARLKERLPDVLVLSLLVQCRALPRTQVAMLDLMYAGGKQVLWTCNPDPSGGPPRVWEDPSIQGCLLQPFTPVQAIVAIEQLIYRRVVQMPG